MDRNEVFNSISHGIGAALALAGLVILVIVAAKNGDARSVTAFSIYGSLLFLLFLISTLYHGLPGRAKHVFRILDHQAIYLLIAGTYTPFTLVTLRGPTGWWLFGAIWSMAAIGMLLDALPRRGARIVPVFIYLAMGWLALFALDPLIQALPENGFRWLLIGGLLYTGGILFFVLDHWYPWAHGIWHLFVLAGAIAHYFTILVYVR